MGLGQELLYRPPGHPLPAGMSVAGAAAGVPGIGLVEGGGAARQRAAHFLGNGHEQPVEDFQPHRVGRRPTHRRDCARGMASQTQGAVAIDRHAPTRLDHRGRQRIDHDHRAIRSEPRRQRRADMGHGQANAPAQHVLDLQADRADRIQRRARALEDHRDLVAADVAHRRLGEAQQIAAGEAHGAGDDAELLRSIGEEAERIVERLLVPHDEGVADRLEPGERCASTSNRNFEGRQGNGGRTHLVSPAMAAAAAIEGHFVDVRKIS